MNGRRSRDGLFIFLILLVCYGYFLPRWADWNQNSRFDLVRAVVEKGTLAIDDYAENTGDYATVGGHIYSDKAPGLAFAAVPIHAAANAMMQIPAVDSLIQRLAASPAFGDTLREGGSGLLADKVRHALGMAVATFLLVMLPSALLGVLIYRFLGDLNFSRPIRIATPIIYGLATSAFPYSGAFYGHQFTAVLLFAAFYLAFQMRQRQAFSSRKDAKAQEGQTRWAMPAIGFLLAYAVISEYPTALIGLAVALYAVYAAPDKRWTPGAILAGLPPLVLLGWHNAAIFGSPFKLGYEYSTLWQAEHSAGFLSLSAPTLESIWGVSFDSYRGLYFTAPILLLAWPGLYLFRKAGERRAEWLVCAWSMISFLLFNASSAMWQGGFSIGPRYLVPMLPFAAVALAFGLDAAARRRRTTMAAALLIAWSFGVIWIETIGGQSFPDYTSNPLFNYSLPRLLDGDVARNLGMLIGLRGWASLLPLAVAYGLLWWLLMKGPLAATEVASTTSTLTGEEPA